MTAILLSDVMLPTRKGCRSSGQQKIILRELMAGRCSINRLIGAVWPEPDDEPDWADATVRVQVCRLRRRLRKGWAIKGEYTFGYSLVEPAPLPNPRDVV